MWSALGASVIIRERVLTDEEMKVGEEDEKAPETQPNIGSFVYSNPQHSGQVLDGLRDVRDSCEFADITLCVGNMQFKCHKLVLSLASPYFRSMFTSGMKESSAAEVTMRDIEPAIFSKIVDYIYKGEILIEESNFQPLLEAGNMLQLETLCDGCAKYLEKELTSSNCLGFWLFGQRLNNDSLTKTALAYARQHFDGVQHEEEFLNLSAQDLCQYIGDDTINVKSEDDIGQGVMAWLQRDPAKRLVAMKDVILFLRLNHLSMEYLRLHMMRSECLKQSPECIQLVDRAMDMQLFPEAQMFELHSTFPRLSMGVEQCLLVFGRRLPKNMALRDKTHVMRYQYYDDDLYRSAGYRTSEGRPVHAVPLQGESNEAYINGGASHWVTHERVAACTVRNEVFLAGLGSRCDEIWKYDGHRGDWQKCASLTKLCSPSCALAVGEKIYIFGGIHIQDSKTTRLPLAAFEEYSIRSNRCRVVGELERPVQDMACAVYQGIIYVMGGTDDTGSPTALTQLININKNPATIEQGPVLLFAPKRLRVAQYKDVIFVVTEKALLYCTVSLLGAWQTVSSLGVGNSSFACCLVNHYLYVVGGPHTKATDDIPPEKTAADKKQEERNAKKDRMNLAAALYQFGNDDSDEYGVEYDMSYDDSDDEGDEYCGSSVVTYNHIVGLRGRVNKGTPEQDKPDETLVFRVKVDSVLSAANSPEKQRELVWEKFATLPREVSVDSVCSVARPEHKKPGNGKDAEKRIYVLA